MDRAFDIRAVVFWCFFSIYACFLQTHENNAEYDAVTGAINGVMELRQTFESVNLDNMAIEDIEAVLTSELSVYHLILSEL